ncbi:transcription factor MYB1-like [Rosa rugosa]|uniref:transcription factor MYB1-like n=1 Tax=Rosa rugosa TaxID=74645 RepID=UPI002B40B04C|nr:transcription factor MYB1-like [Rosa rugosa]
MGRSSTYYDKNDGLKKGAWAASEDQIVKADVKKHGVGKWGKLSRESGNSSLKRCGKRVRLRWLNYLRPDIIKGNITEDEEELIIRLHKLLGNRKLQQENHLEVSKDEEIKEGLSSSAAAADEDDPHLTKNNVIEDEDHHRQHHDVDVGVGVGVEATNNNGTGDDEYLRDDGGAIS